MSFHDEMRETGDVHHPKAYRDGFAAVINNGNLNPECPFDPAEEANESEDWQRGVDEAVILLKEKTGEL